MKKTHSIWEFLAETLREFPGDSEKETAIQSIDTIIEYFSKLKERIRSLPGSTQCHEILAAVEKLSEFTESAKNNPAVAAALGLMDKKTGKTKVSRAVLPDIAGERLFNELKLLQTQDIQQRLLDYKKTSMAQLRALARFCRIAEVERAKREDLVDKIVKLGFANVRGYEMLRSEKNPEGQPV